jgi:flagellar hook-associated protein 1 FlgK
MTGALQIGKSALLAYQSALQVVGNNVTNAGSEYYTRQTPVLRPANGVVLPEGFMPGGGVALTALKRNVDESLENRIRIALGEQAGAQVERQLLARIEGIFNELSENDLSSLMQEFFNAFSELQNQPHDLGSRTIVLTAGETIVRELLRQRTELLELRDELNDELTGVVGEANRLADAIARINVEITELESTGSPGANALRDKRDGMLRDLGELVQIQVRPQPGGSVNVYVGNELLIQGGLNRGFTTRLDTVNEQPRVIVLFADNNAPITMNGGKMEGLVLARDAYIQGQVDALNSLAGALIREVNQVHARGQGLEGFTSATGTYTLDDVTAALTDPSNNLAFVPMNGSFLIHVRDTQTDQTRTIQINVDLDGSGTDDSLQTLVDQINAKATNLTAEVTADGRLRITSADGYEFSFAEDSSNVLAALGVNTFFTGTDAQDIGINTALTLNPFLLAAATQNTPGDGSNAAAIARLGQDPQEGLNGQSLNEYYTTIATRVATTAASALNKAESIDAIVLSLTAQRESISGVSLDEEAIQLIRFERAFQGAARYTTTVDRLLQELMALVG